MKVKSLSDRMVGSSNRIQDIEINLMVIEKFIQCTPCKDKKELGKIQEFM